MTEELAPSEVARRLGTSTRTVQRWIERGVLPARRVGGRWRVAFDAFDAPLPDAAPGPSPIHTLFIANRGEIARRIVRTCDRLGIRAVVPEIDGSYGLDLLDAKAVVAAAGTSGADAVHPGFGFLAENAEFAERVIAAGLRWVGPPPDAMRAMGDKAAARRLAASLGIPILVGYDESDQTDSTLAAAAERISYPVLIKPAAGGGGKGMRIVRNAADFLDSLAAARREARSAFGDDRVILERFVEGARHVEIQLLFDAHGTGVHLGERDCSLQRRHQKILEESPSPAVGEDLRKRLGDAALELGRAVGYVNAGTCEFLVDDRGEATFMEMNTRLQVEHPVTELVTGRDLVEDQLRIAAGEPLGVAQADINHAGHAIEVRLYAEDAEDGFLPATGRIEALRWPVGTGVRVDAGIDHGTDVGARFDPMLAKIVAWGADRNEALARLTVALDDTLVLGLVTNLRFLRWLVRQPVVRDGAARIDTLDRIWPPDDWDERARIPEEAWTSAAVALASPSREGPAADPWAGGWRLNSAPRLRLEADGLTRSVAIGAAAPALETVVVGGVAHIDVAGRSVVFALAPAPDVDRAAALARGHGTGLAAGPARLVAPMPGSVLTVHVSVGATVEAGDPIVTLEAMKMEHVVAAPAAGRLTELRVRPADQVTRGQDLGLIEP
jgi:acetyl-CoA/propionyl-CoA carboxylase, biotin carboxylase, biotin carboxyl carrier protein